MLFSEPILSHISLLAVGIAVPLGTWTASLAPSLRAINSCMTVSARGWAV